MSLIIVLSLLVYVAQAGGKTPVEINVNNTTCTFENVYPAKQMATGSQFAIAALVVCSVLLIAEAAWNRWIRYKCFKLQLQTDVGLGFRPAPVVLPAPLSRREKKGRRRQCSEVRLDTLAPSEPQRATEISPNEVSPPVYAEKDLGSFGDSSSLLP